MSSLPPADQPPRSAPEEQDGGSLSGLGVRSCHPGANRSFLGARPRRLGVSSCHLGAQWQQNPAVTDDLRATLGITIPSGSRTATPVPSTRPVLSADTSQRLQITIDFVDAGATSKAKPTSVRGCQLWEQIGVIGNLRHVSD